MSAQDRTDQEMTTERLRALQDQFWSRDVCEIALAVRRMWQAMANDLQLSDDAVHAITNLAKASTDNTLSISELAAASDLTIERAAEAIDVLVSRGWAVRTLPRLGEDVADRRVQLPTDLVGTVFGFYRLQKKHRQLLDQFSPEEIDVARRFLDVFVQIANDQAVGINTGQINPAADLKTSLHGTG